MRKSILSSLMLALCLCVLALSGCASSKDTNQLDRQTYAYSAAIRWGDFEGAWTLVDPKYREAHPLSDVELERYKQVQIAGYRDLAEQVLPDGDVVREIEIDVVNRHTLTQRQTRYTERWRFDAESKTWWLVVGLPDLWQD
ncbi:hypothetical protein LF41_1915 [Lysobacter dokdonensis DS-58]|uniref:Lipoprotein n=1 Tax=Lysobacter dokdonensis DS-58 TaxID=1300345 RepID=A0A0A2WHU7_9GAMM|nr:hypothetical protein [Lysobacter dokdonensis]KGQ17840.1 hypothetical protein LF41_1915 [Lysobacter dokdonensis DS-58]